MEVNGLSVRVPSLVVSLADITAVLKRDVTKGVRLTRFLNVRLVRALLI